MPHVIDANLLIQSILFCRFSLAAYSQGDPRQVNGLNTRQLSDDTRLPRGFTNNPTDTQCLLCLWNNDVVVAFRGTESLTDIRTDCTGKFVPCADSEGRVHAGFQQSLNVIYPEILHGISLLPQDSGDGTPGPRRIFVCGHSLGGALAVLFANRLQQLSATTAGNIPRIAKIFTYGSPRVGDAQFCQQYENSAAGQATLQWVDPQDLVTHLAPLSLQYRHALRFQHYVDASAWVRRMPIDENKTPNHLTLDAHSLEKSYLSRLLTAGSQKSAP